MKKRTAAMLCLLLLSALSACKGSPVFCIRYDLGNTAHDFLSLPEEAKAGDTVELKTEVLLDADIHVYVDGQEISKSHYDGDFWGYSFVMPEKDVLITARFYTKAEIWGE